MRPLAFGSRRRFAHLYPGEAKTDARDAFIIADAARAMPHSLRSIDGADEAIAEPEMIVGFDDDLAGEATRIANRLHGLLTQIHPSPERVLGPRLQHPGVLTLLERFGSPTQIRKAGRRRLVTLLRPKAPRMTERLVEDIFTAQDEQTVTVPGTEAAALMVPSLAGSLTAVLDQRKLLAGRIEDRMPGGLRPTTSHRLDQRDRARPRAASCRGEAVGSPLTACRTVSRAVDDACVRRGLPSPAHGRAHRTTGGTEAPRRSTAAHGRRRSYRLSAHAPLATVLDKAPSTRRVCEGVKRRRVGVRRAGQGGTGCE
ncbi:transposase IS111A/IS1328/IS1533 [Actinobacteria bacterium OK006]|nr:transposase IS111A/IS1328/IS1533 [Actinobacteria bacterium OK006]